MNWFELSEDVLVLRPEYTNAIAEAIERANLEGVIDLVITDEEVAVQYDGEREPSELINEIAQLEIRRKRDQKAEIFKLPVCYELGEDLEEVLEMTNVGIEEFIKEHTSIEYKAAYGFIPGFLYLSGLPDHLHCPRKQNPRTTIPAGSVGIGGNKTGVYSLESPGGWQIIGRTPLTLFDIDRSPPTVIPHGGSVQFVRISKAAFENWNGST